MTMADTRSEFGLKFSDPRIVMTKYGEREVRTAPPNETFWTAWRANKDALKKRGYSVGKPYGADPDCKTWEITLWSQTMSHADRARAAAASWAGTSDIVVPKPADCPHDYYPFQRAGIAYALEREGTLIGDEMGCVAGAAVVRVNRAGKGMRMTLAELHRKWRRWDPSITTYVRALCGDEFRLHEVRNVLAKGTKEVVRLTLASGKSLRLTADHEVAVASGGWTAAGDLTAGDAVLTNGTGACARCGSTEDVVSYRYAKFLGYCRTCVYRYKRADKWGGDGKYLDKDGYVRVSGQWDHPRQCRGVVPEHILVVEKRLGRYLLPDEEVHHRNAIKHDNGEENLEVVNRSVHHRLHAKHRHFDGGPNKHGEIIRVIPVSDRVVSVEPDGVAEVYDLVMAGPHRNFVANGIVVHNCGKTIQGIGFANIIKAKKILVVAPATLLANWRNEIHKWQTLGLPVNVVRPENPLYAVTDGWTVINYDIVSRCEGVLRSVEWDVMISDECHNLKNPDAKRTKILLGNAKGEGAIKAKRRLMMTGTPILNRPIELWPILHNLDPKRWDRLNNFKFKYCGGWDGMGATNLEELNARLRETVMVRRLKKDVLKELPAKRRQMVAIAVEDEELEALLQEELEVYEKREAEMIEVSAAVQRAEAEGNEAVYKECVEKLRELEGIAFNEMSRVRHETALRKVGYVIEHVKTVLEEKEEKLLLFGHHADVIEALVEGLKSYGVVSITGRTPNDKRQPIVERFQTDPSIRVFIGNIQAAGVGLTLTASSHVVFAELDWTPAKVSQAEDRCHRIGQKESVLIQHVVLDGSLDAKIAKMLIAKQEVIDRALNDRIEVAADQPRPEPQRRNIDPDRAGDYADAQAEAVTLVPDQDPRQSPAGDRRMALDKVAAGLLPEQIRAVHEALKAIAALDADHARELNDCGFSKYDTLFGCELAAKASLSPRQAAAAMKMVRKYRRQYSVALYRTIFREE